MTTENNNVLSSVTGIDWYDVTKNQLKKFNKI